MVSVTMGTYLTLNLDILFVVKVYSAYRTSATVAMAHKAQFTSSYAARYILSSYKIIHINVCVNVHFSFLGHAICFVE